MVNCSVTQRSSVILKNETILEFLFESILEFSFFVAKGLILWLPYFLVATIAFLICAT